MIMVDRRASTSSFPDLQRMYTSPPEYSLQVNGSEDESESEVLNEVIPEPSENRSRTLVLCFDGTGDQFDDDNSNVVQFFSMLKKDDWRQQLVYYQSGIGTYNIPQVARPWMAKIQRVVDSMVGVHLNAHVMTGYEFIMQNYQSGDKICLFGFSRGAYTARALAGMIHKVGLLPRYNHQQVPFAYKMYSREDERGWKQASAFKKAFSIDVDVEFLGVWDTVSSVGFVPRRLPFTTSNTSVRYFRHALALDEHRARFVPNFWHRTTKKEEETVNIGRGFGLGRRVMPKVRTGGRRGKGKGKGKRDRAHTVQGHEGVSVAGNGDDKSAAEGKGNTEAGPGDQEHGGEDKDKGKTKKVTLEVQPVDATPMMREMEALYSDGQHGSDVQEVWFAGCHCDVGGGAVPNETRNALSRIPLRWMIRQTFLTNTGIMFHREMLKDVGLDPATLWPIVHPRPPPISLEDFKRRKSQIHGPGEPSLPSASSALSREATLVQADTIVKADSNVGDTLGGSTLVPGRLTRTQRLRSVFLQDFVNEEEEDLKDALSEINDELVSVKAWWVLELLPQKVKYQNENDEWVEKILWGNMGRARHVPSKHGVRVHRTVKMRMDADKAQGKYIPRPKWNFEPIWVD
ncbi:hypothetical protein K435DRAFT_721914, partial [Dendrothele bispora CBS 962.96]